MARKVRSATIDSRTARLRLASRKKPYSFTSIGPGIALAYRRTTKGSGRWVVRCADGRGGNWTKVLAACADDYEIADGEHVLDFHQAAAVARALARGKDDVVNARPITNGEALDEFERDLTARDGLAANARRVRYHLPPALASKPVALTTMRDYRRFRDGMLAKGLAGSTVARNCRAMAAALSLAASLDPRVGSNRAAWREGLGGLADTHVARKVRLPDADILVFMSAAYENDGRFGLLVETIAQTGARPVQLERAVIADLQDDRPDPRIMMPSSRKGRRKKRIVRYAVPITPGLAAKLRDAAGQRSPTDPLLLQSSGEPWNAEARRWPFGDAVARAGLKGLTAYSLRHASIIRQLLAGVPVRVCAVHHDTSVAMLERSYSAFISEVSDVVTRRALIDTSPGAVADKVVPLSRGGR